VTDISFTRTGYWAHVGIEAVSVGSGAAVARVRLEGKHLGVDHSVHGGAISSVVDAAAGLAVRSLRSEEEMARRPHATTDLHVTYIGPPAGCELIARSTVVREGRAAFFVEVPVSDESGSAIGRGSAIFVVVSEKTGGR
jgi:uncharacterized protein (TIGR00369 family)